MNRICSISLLCLFFVLTFTECRKKPDYSNTPEITLNTVRQYEVYSANRGVMVDSLILSVNFKDGDGDLGVDQDDLNQAKYSDTFNIVVDVYRKTGTIYTQLHLVPSYNGNFPVLSPKNVKGPIDGVLEYNIVIAHSPFQPVSDVLRFDIRILDREFHISNLVSTPDITVNTP